MRLSSKAVKQYAKTVNKLGDKAAGEFERYARKVLANTDDVETAKRLLVRKAYQLATKYGNAAATVGAEFYEQVAYETDRTVREAVLARTASQEMLESNFTFHSKCLYGADPDKMLFASKMGETVARHVRRAAHDTVTENAVRDKRKGARWARVADGGACDFCLMLESRGFVYASKENAGLFDHYHDHCRCTVVPNFGKDASL